MKVSLFVLAAATVIAAFAPVKASAFTASYSWAGVAACQKISPAFTLSAVPTGTRRLRFVMTDLDMPSFHHGGGIVIYDGENVPQGAISYIGPCPPAGQHHRYLWAIDALDDSGNVLGRTTVTQTFPP